MVHADFATRGCFRLNMNVLSKELEDLKVYEGSLRLIIYVDKNKVFYIMSANVSNNYVLIRWGNGKVKQIIIAETTTLICVRVSMSISCLYS